jgi:hypothetical protein
MHQVWQEGSHPEAVVGDAMMPSTPLRAAQDDIVTADYTDRRQEF